MCCTHYTTKSCILRFTALLRRPVLLSLSLCLPLFLSLSVSRSLAPSFLATLCSLSSLSPGVCSRAAAASYTPLLAVPCQAYRRSHGGVLNSV